MRSIVIYNSRSGSALPLDALKQLFKNTDISVLKYIDITQEGYERAVATYRSTPSIVLIGYGGDGTLNSVAEQAVKHNMVFAPLPGGTLNHFTKDLGVNQDIERAIARIPQAKRHSIDTAQVNGRLFLNNSSLGIYPTSLQERSRLEDIIGKWPAALYASIRAFVRFRIYTITINEQTYKTPFIFVGNNLYNIDSLMERKAINGGVLGVYMVASSKRLTLVKIALLALIGRARSANEFKAFETNTIEIHIDRRYVRVSYDGEHHKIKTPIHYTIQQKSLTVLV